MSNDKYIVSKLDNETYCVKNGQFSRHLKANDMTFQEYWECYVTLVTPICPYCASKVTFQQGTRTYASTCGEKVCKNKMISTTKQSWTDAERKADSANKKKALAKRTADEINVISTKRKATCLAIHGVEYTTQSAQMKNATAATKLEKYGDANYNNSAQSAEANRSKTVEEQNEINEKRRATNIDKFGVECCYLMPDVVSKSMKTQAEGKEYITPSGKTLHIRGYEPHVLDELYQIYDEDDIYIEDISDSVENKMIFNYKNVHNYTNRYYPDICIKSKNLIIEVKSWWWYNGNGDDKYKGRYINNTRKAKACRDAGYTHEFWIYNNKTMEKTII